MNRINRSFVSILLLLLLLCSGPSLQAQQKVTQIKGTITDADTGEPVSFAYIILPGKNIGIMSDLKGLYEIETRWAGTSMQVSCLGYSSVTLPIIYGERQEINIKLQSTTTALDEIVVTGSQRAAYKNRGNPAVDLMRNVIKHKGDNRLESKDYYQFEKYEKTEFSFNNFTDELWDSKALRNFQFLKQYIDTSTVNGKPYLPLFLKENLYEQYFRKSPKTSRTVIKGSHMVGIDQYYDQSGIDQYLTQMMGNVNIYDNDIDMLDNRFVSPLSFIAPQFYKFFIRDTVNVGDTPCIHLSFLPRNPEDMGFSGNIYITNDSAYAVRKVIMKFVRKINVNFINDLELQQEFEWVNGMWVLSQDQITIDFNILESAKAIGVFARSRAMYKNFVFDRPLPDSMYYGSTKIIRLVEAENQDESAWDTLRHEPLTKSEAGIYTMMDTLREVPAFRRAMNIIMTVVTGYVEYKGLDFGPVDAMISHNEIEGFRFRIGGRTNALFNDHLYLEGYSAYGLKDKKIKYMGGVTWSFPAKKYHAWEYPIHNLSLSYQYNTQIPGQQLFYATSDNVLLSFQRGVFDKMTYDRNLTLQYEHELKGGLGLRLTLKNLESVTAGSLIYSTQQAGGGLQTIPGITTSEATLRIRYAPNELFYQNKRNRVAMNSTSPILMLQHTVGVKGIINGEYNYQKTEISGQKRFWISTLGLLDVLGKYGRVWGTAPYPLLIIHNANQTYSYRKEAYNMMNFLEFISDQYASIDINYNMNGFFLNKVPVLKKLKLREVFTFKSLWGELHSRNLPENNSSLFVFPTDTDGNPSSFVLGNKPYMEASVGVTNIFKLFRVDLVKRLSYRDNPNVSNLGVRAMIYFTF